MYLSDGVTIVAEGSFISFAEGLAGLKFTPALNSVADGHFTVQASVSADDSGLGGETVSATITVNPVNDAPVRTGGSLTPIRVNEDSANAPAVTLGLGGLAYAAGGGRGRRAARR